VVAFFVETALVLSRCPLFCKTPFSAFGGKKISQTKKGGGGKFGHKADGDLGLQIESNVTCGLLLL